MSNVATLQKNISVKSSGLNGVVVVPGDKSISHRSLMISSQAIGVSKISGLLEGEDVLATAEALRNLGVQITKEKNGDWVVNGVGVGGLRESSAVLDLGNSGTGVRLMMGLVSTYPFTTNFTGDTSLCSRPMSRVMKPLEEMGVNFNARTGGRLPLSVVGTPDVLPIKYELPVASAQVKSAILFAGINCRGNTTVVEPVKTRDHTELMLKNFGATLDIKDLPNGGREITIHGYPELKARDIVVPGDPSSAAFLVVAALIVPNSKMTIKNICMNPLRTGLYDTLIEMGANIKFENKRKEAGDEVADIVVTSSKLKGIKVPANRAPAMIDEYPILSVAAACAEGKTMMEGLEELRVKESDRLEAVANGLKKCGVQFEMGKDWLEVTGGQVAGGGLIETFMDHRIAMSFLVMGMISKNPVEVDDGSMINTSFPGFAKLMNSLGAGIENV